MEFTKKEKRGLALFDLLLHGRASAEERTEYINLHDTYEEKRMGKLLSEMSAEDFEEYKALEENLKRADRDGGYCPLCRNKGYTAQVEEGRMRFVTCECEKRRENMALVTESDYAHLVTTKRFDNFEVDKPWRKETLRRVKAWTNQRALPVLYLGGKSGTGKTHLAIAAFYQLVLCGNRGKLISWRDESRDLKFRMTEYGYYDKKIRELKTIPLLMIDDFLWQPTNGNSLPTDEDLRLAKEILDGRINMGLKTIITSNYSIGELNKIEVVLGGRIYQSSGGSENYCVSFGATCENYRAKKIPSLVDLAEQESPFDELKGGAAHV